MNREEIENKWRRYWEEHKTFKTDTSDFSKIMLEVIDMFLYIARVG